METNSRLAERIFQLIAEDNSEGLRTTIGDIKEETELRALDVATDREGNPILHAAFASMNPEIFRIILELDLKLDVVNRGNQTVLQLAEEQGLQELSALLGTRQEWQGTIQTFRFNRVVKLINESLPKIAPASGENQVLFVGATGAGKSTLLNYLNGTDYSINFDRAGRPFVQRVGGLNEVARVGDNLYKSETLHPQVVKTPGLDFVYCDLAGLFDSRGTEKQICAASSANLLVQLASNYRGKGIKGILLLLDLPGFESLRGRAFKKTALALAEIVRMNPELLDMVYFVITKTPADAEVSADAIVDEYVEPLLESLDGRLDHEEMALAFVLKAMKNRTSQILIPDLGDRGLTRRLIERVLTNSPVRDPNLFDFLSHDNAQECFNSVLLNIAQGYLKRKQQIDVTLPEKVSETTEKISSEQLQIEQWQREIANIDQELQGNFNADNLRAAQASKRAQITQHQQSILAHRASILACNTKITELTRELAGIDNDDMIELEKKRGGFSDNPRAYTMRYKSPYPLDRITTNYFGRGALSSRQVRPAMSGKKEVDPRDGVLCDIYNADSDAKNGVYEAEFNASEGLTSVEVTFYAKRRDMHVARITECKRLLQEAHQNSANLSRHEIPRLETEIARLNAAIMQDSRDILSGEATLQIRKSALAIQKTELEELINVAQERTRNFQHELQQYEQQIDRTNLEIEVNQETFTSVHNIIKLLKLTDGDYAAFQRDYEAFLVARTRRTEPNASPMLFAPHTPLTLAQRAAASGPGEAAAASMERLRMQA